MTDATKRRLKMSNKRKAEVFDQFVIETSKFITATTVLDCFDGNIGNDELVISDYREALNPFFELLTDEEITEILQKIFPKLMMQEFGAKVTVRW